MSFGAGISLSTVASFAIAVLVLRFLLRRVPPHKTNGTWIVDLTLGSERAGLYTKAFAAWNSLFALRAPEAVYFTAIRDSEGKQLECGATYLIEGRDPAGRWWSLTAYKKNRLIPNSLGRYSFSQSTVKRGEDGGWRIHLSPEYQAENWLPSGDPEGNLGLTLRVYGPSAAVLADPKSAHLPVIRREANA